MGDDVPPDLVEELLAFYEAVREATTPPKLSEQQQVRALDIRLPRPPALQSPEALLADCIANLSAQERNQLTHLVAKMKGAMTSPRSRR